MNHKFIKCFLILLISGMVTIYCSSSSDKENEQAEFSVNAELQNDQMMILSIPSGLKIYFSSDPGTTKPSEDGYIPIAEKDPLINEKNYKGQTPFIISGIKPGKYLLGVDSVYVLGKDGKRGEIDHHLEVLSLVSSIPLSSSPGSFGESPIEKAIKETGIKGSVIYSIDYKKQEPMRVIVYSLFGDTTLEEMDKKFPAKAEFKFDDLEFAKKTEKWLDIFPQDEMNKIKGLLKRGGKVIYQKGDIMINAEAKLDGKLDINLLIRPSK